MLCCTPWSWGWDKHLEVADANGGQDLLHRIKLSTPAKQTEISVCKQQVNWDGFIGWATHHCGGLCLKIKMFHKIHD